MLRKDFILDELQIAEARGAGASAILLIVRALSPGRLAELAGAAREWGLEALVEVHDARELDVALENGARIVGVNSRNLDTFAVDTRAAWTLFRAHSERHRCSRGERYGDSGRCPCGRRGRRRRRPDRNRPVGRAGSFRLAPSSPPCLPRAVTRRQRGAPTRIAAFAPVAFQPLTRAFGKALAR